MGRTFNPVSRRKKYVTNFRRKTREEYSIKTVLEKQCVKVWIRQDRMAVFCERSYECSGSNEVANFVTIG